MTTKKDFCCMILCGYGTGQSAGERLCDHLQSNGIDAVLVTPCDGERLRMSRRYWTHLVRMRYLSLRKEYSRIAVIGISVGGMLQMYLAELKPAAAVFINSPTAESTLPEMRRVFRRDFQPEMKRMQTPVGYYQFWRFVRDTQKQPLSAIECPTLILQTKDDKVSDPENAEKLFQALRTDDKYIHYYEKGGHDVLGSSMEMAVCSSVFQFCSAVRG